MPKEIDDAVNINASGSGDVNASLALLDDVNKSDNTANTARSWQIAQNNSDVEKDSAQTIVMTPVEGFHHSDAPISGATISVDSDINNKVHGLTLRTGNEPHHHSFDLGIIGFGDSSPSINEKLQKSALEVGRYGADVQSTVISGEVHNDLPLTSAYLRRDASSDLVNLVGRHGSIEREQNKPLIAGAGAETLKPPSKLENRFSANPEQYNILDVRRDLPPNFNADGSSDYVLNALSSEVKNAGSAAQYTDKHGNLRSHTEIHSRSGNVSTDVSIANQDEADKLRLLFFTIKNTEHRDFPGAVVEVANRLKFNADSMRALQFAEREKDPTVRRATELAIVQQQLKQFGTKYFDIAWDEAKKLPLNMSKEDDLVASRVRIERLLTDMNRVRNITSVQHEDAAQPRPETTGRGLSESEKEEAAKLYATLFTREDYLRCVGRAKYDW